MAGRRNREENVNDAAGVAAAAGDGGIDWA